MTTATTTFTVLFNPTTTQRTTWLDRSRDSYEIDLDTTYEVEQTFATFVEAVNAARALCGKTSVCCVVQPNGPVEFFADADTREQALRERETCEGAQHNYLACIVRNEPQVDGDFDANNPF